MNRHRVLIAAVGAALFGEDIGRDDFGPCKTFTTDDAATIALRLAEVSFWNLQRTTPPGRTCRRTTGSSASCSSR
jgi:hypothetical protein